MDTIYFGQHQPPVQFDSAIVFPHYTLKDTIVYDCSQNYTTG